MFTDYLAVLPFDENVISEEQQFWHSSPVNLI